MSVAQQYMQLRTGLSLDTCDPNDPDIISIKNPDGSARRFKINGEIRRLLEQFYSPSKAIDAAERYIEQSSDKQQSTTSVLSFIEQLAGLFIESTDNQLATLDAEIANYLQSIGYKIEKVFKNKPSFAVYKVQEISTGEPGVVRLLKTSGSKDISLDLARLELETTIQQKMAKYPEFLATKKIVHSEYPCYLMKYSSAKSLRKFLTTNQTLSLKARLLISYKLLSAMLNLHREDVIHGDFQFSNILIDEKDLSITVIDFGCAMVFGNSTKPATGAVPHFVAPELANESWVHVVESLPTYESESYQLGVMLYYLFYGKMPFRGKVYKELYQAIKSEMPVFPAMTAHEEIIPQYVIATIRNLLNKQPGNRQESARNLHSALGQDKEVNQC